MMRIWKRIEQVLPHVAIVLSGMMVTFVIIDGINPIMGFINNTGTKVLLALLAVVAIANAIFLVRRQRRDRR